MKPCNLLRAATAAFLLACTAPGAVRADDARSCAARAVAECLKAGRYGPPMCREIAWWRCGPPG